MSKEQAKSFYTQQSGDPTEKYVSAVDAQSAIDVIYDDMPTPGTAGARRFHWAGDVAADPGVGGVISDPTGGQNRTVCLSKTDADGVPVNLSLLLPGDTVTLTDDPASPPITGFARLVVTSDVVDQGDWWQFAALRTDTAGTQTTPANGTMLRVIPTFAAGVPASPVLPVYQYAKGGSFGNIGTSFARLLSLPVLASPAGVYRVGFAAEWIHTVVNAEIYFRLSVDSGSTWRAYSKQNANPDAYQTFFWEYPKEWAGGATTIFLEAKNGSDGGSFDVEYADVWWQQVSD